MNQSLLRKGDVVWYNRSTNSWGESYTQGIVLDLKLDSYGRKSGRPDHIKIRRLHEDGTEWNYPATEEDTEVKPVIDLVHSRKVQDLWENVREAKEAHRLRYAWADERREDFKLQDEWLTEVVDLVIPELKYESGRLILNEVTHDEAPGVQGSLANTYNHNVTWMELMERLAKRFKVKLPAQPEVIWKDHPDYNHETGEMNA
jgi:hypothetical protein